MTELCSSPLLNAVSQPPLPPVMLREGDEGDEKNSNI